MLTSEFRILDLADPGVAFGADVPALSVSNASILSTENADGFQFAKNDSAILHADCSFVPIVDVEWSAGLSWIDDLSKIIDSSTHECVRGRTSVAK